MASLSYNHFWSYTFLNPWAFCKASLNNKKKELVIAPLPELLKVGFMESWNSAKNCQICAKLLAVYSQTIKVMHFYGFYMFLLFLYTTLGILAYFLSKLYDWTRKYNFRRSVQFSISCCCDCYELLDWKHIFYINVFL